MGAGKTGSNGEFADPHRDNADATQGRALVAINPAVTGSKGQSRLTDAVFLAHMFATRFRAPQTCEKRRAEPGDADASYRKAARPPAASNGRVFSRKV